MGSAPDLYAVFRAADRLHMPVPDVLKLPRGWVAWANTIQAAEIEAENERLKLPSRN